MQDPSNERIITAIKKLMKKEDRGFLFCPVPKRGANHKSLFVFVGNSETGQPPVEQQVFTTLLMAMESIRRQVPEDEYRKWKKVYKAYLLSETKLWNMTGVELQ